MEENKSKLSYIIYFEKHGEMIPESQLMENEIWLDVGNALKMGCIDHHQSREYKSTYEALLKNLNYLDNLKKSAEDQKKIYIRVHEQPDMDCIACVYAVKYFLEHTQEEFEALFGKDGAAACLLDYVDEIDQGRHKNTSYPTFYAMIHSIDVGMEKSLETDRMVMEKSEYLFHLAVQKMIEGAEFDIYKTDFSTYVGKEFQYVIDHINHNFYEKEKQDNKILVTSVPIWNEKKGYESVPAAIWKDIPGYQYGYNCAREEGKVITMVPYEIRGHRDSNQTRLMLSVNPEKNPEQTYTLRPIAEILEQMEQLEEYRLYEQEGRFRRDYSRPRIGENFSMKPFSTTSDPWYISSENDMVDAPRIRSLLNYEDIVELLIHNGSALKKSEILRVNTKYELESFYYMENIPLSQWQKETKEILKNNLEKEEVKYMVVLADVDASLIQHDNRILQSYCMNLIGKSYHECNMENFLQLNYHTCIYADKSCMIVLTGTYENRFYEPLLFPKETSRKQIPDSALAKNTGKILRQYHSLMNFEKRIGKSIYYDQKYVEKVNEEVLSFLANLQEENAILEQTEKDVYLFLQKQFEIKELTDSVLTTLGLLVEERRNKQVSKFNVMSSLAVPFVLIATLFQMGIVKFEELLELNNGAAIGGWVVTFILNVVLVVGMMRMGEKKEKDWGEEFPEE